MLLAPLSSATALEGGTALKISRLATTLLIVTIGVVFYRCFYLRQAFGSFVAFVFLFVLAACWSTSPTWGLFHKGLFALTVLSGGCLGYSVRDFEDLRKGMRWLSMVSALAAFAVAFFYLRDPAQAVQGERLSLWGMNANTIGQTAAPLWMFCLYLGLYERSRWWKAVGFGVSLLLTLIILGTGSRAACVMAATGGFFLALSFIKRPAVFALLTVTAFVGVVVFQSFRPEEITGVGRMSEDLFKDTRSGVWSYAIKQFSESPVIGQGWLHWGTHSANVMNIYLHTIAETGVFGGAILFASLAMVAFRMLRMFTIAARSNLDKSTPFLALAFTAAPLVHGLAESATFLGTSINALMLGFGIALIDRIPEMAQSKRPSFRQIGRRHKSSTRSGRGVVVVRRRECSNHLLQAQLSK
ncbi:O-antigen ligase family protein [Symmachiella macrocystis]|uniref:O-antigen ligase family protein n=1 Tax=Symmachiella macrocystis TaxID=2527985 RepID=UPI0011B6F533|nr:O-antigen ligase family protein [Symmachiella macrocystis]